MIPQIDIWRVANLMLKRYGDRARQESARHADDLWAAGDHHRRGNLASNWRRDRAAREHDTSRAAKLTEAICWHHFRCPLDRDPTEPVLDHAARDAALAVIRLRHP